MSSAQPDARDNAELVNTNRRFYDPLWAQARLIDPKRFNTWPLVSSLVLPFSPRLEVAPGLRPRLPIEGTQFVDNSAPAIAKLHARGANAVLGLVTALPFADAAFELVCALDIVEHIDDGEAALRELARVSAQGAALLISAPLHRSRWTAFDDAVGHRRRYEPEQLLSELAQHGFSVERSAAYGMRPASSRLVGVGMWFLAHRREFAMWWYNRVFHPLGMHFQKKLTFSSGMIGTENVDEVLLVCRKDRAPT